PKDGQPGTAGGSPAVCASLYWARSIPTRTGVAALPVNAPARVSSGRAARGPRAAHLCRAGRCLARSCAQRAGLVEPAVQGDGAGVATDQHVLDGAADAALLAGGVRDLTQQIVGGLAVVFLGIGMHFKVLDVEV